MEPTASPPPARRKHRKLRTIGIVLGGLVTLLIIAVAGAALLVDSSAVAAQVKNRVLPQLSERIGRQVEVETIDVSIFPVPNAELGGIRVEGVGDRPLLASESARARLDLWPLITSLGKEIRFESVELQGTEVNLVRFRDGTWDYERILERLEQQQGQQAEAGGSQRAFAIDQVAITDGTIRMIDQSAPGGTATAELGGIEATARHIEPGQPMELDLRAALQSNRSNVEASLRIDPLPADFAALGPGNWPVVTGSLRVDNAPLASLRNLLPAGLDEVATGGAVHLTGEVKTEDERYVASGTGGIRSLQLRGEPAQADFGYTARIDPSTKATEVALRDIDVNGPGVEMGGTASLRTAPVRFEFALAGPLLDLDALMGVMPEQPEGALAEEKSQALVPPGARRSVEQATGRGTIEVERLVSGKLTATDVKAQATLQGGVLTLQNAQAGFYGGTVRADGTTANLVEEVPGWHLVAQMEGVDLQQAMDAISGFAPLGGALGSKVDLRGAGIDWEALRDALTGAAAIELDEGQLATINLDQAVAGSLAQGLRAIGQPGSAERIEAGAATTLRDLRTRVKVDDGWMVLQQPIAVNTGFGTMQLDGRIGLDWQLALEGTARLSPEFVSQVTGGKLRPSEPVALPMQLGGTLRSPAVASFDTEQIARALLPTGQVEKRVAKEVEKGKEKARQEAQRRARDVLKDVF